MPAKTKKAAEQYTFIAVHVETYSADISARINHKALDKRHQQDDVRIYEFGSRFEIAGYCSYPDEHLDEKYHITVYGERPGERDFDATLADFAVRDEKGVRKYRTLRGRHVPLYKDPHGLGMIEKERGTKNWHGWLTVPEVTATQMLSLLTMVRPLYLEIHERKVERTRWIKGFGLKTTHPAYE